MSDAFNQPSQTPQPPQDQNVIERLNRLESALFPITYQIPEWNKKLDEINKGEVKSYKLLVAFVASQTAIVLLGTFLGYKLNSDQLASTISDAKQKIDSYTSATTNRFGFVSGSLSDKVANAYWITKNADGPYIIADLYLDLRVSVKGEGIAKLIGMNIKPNDALSAFVFRTLRGVAIDDYIQTNTKGFNDYNFIEVDIVEGYPASYRYVFEVPVKSCDDFYALSAASSNLNASVSVAPIFANSSVESPSTDITLRIHEPRFPGVCLLRK
jgi:hypothetical protein